MKMLLHRTLPIFAGLLTISCSLFTRLPSTEAPAANQPETSGLIAYVGTDSNIYTIEPLGQNRIALTSDAVPPTAGESQRSYQYPTWSPDGSQVAYVEFSRSPGSGPEAVLHTASPDGLNHKGAFTSQEYFPFYLYWSPDSRYISFLSSASDQAGLTLHLVAPKGGEQRLLGSGQPFYWDWSPGSSQILTHTGGASSENPAARLSLLSIDDELQDRSLNLRPTFFQAPDWSPLEAEFVLAAERLDGEPALLLVSQDGETQRDLALLKGPVAFEWSPSGDRLAYLVQEGDDPSSQEKALYVLDLGNPDGQKRLVQTPIAAFFWSPDGRKIAYFYLTQGAGGATIRTSLQAPDVLIGLSVVDVDTAERQQLLIFEPTQAFLDVLPFFDQYHHSTTFWSPDSQRLVISRLTNGRDPGLYVLDANGDNSPTRIADGLVGFWSWK